MSVKSYLQFLHRVFVDPPRITDREPFLPGYRPSTFKLLFNRDVYERYTQYEEEPMSLEPIQYARQFRLYLTGSAYASDEMRKYAFAAVKRAKELGWAIVTGDNVGIDSAVMDACNLLGVNYICVGVYAKARSLNFKAVRHGGTGRYIRVTSYNEKDYRRANRYLAEMADRALFISNGATRDNTMYTHEYMGTLGAPRDLKTFYVKPATRQAVAEHAFAM